VPIYIDEHLTKPTIELINQAENLKKQGKLTTVFCRDGKVKIRENENSLIVRIASVTQLNQFKKRGNSLRSPGDEENINSGGRNQQQKRQFRSLAPSTASKLDRFKINHK